MWSSVQQHGSSPLARGLLPAWLSNGEHVRIIPARAGFTPQASPPPGILRDHPRSRGVYDGGEWLVGAGLGSSPLARGLRGRLSSRRRGTGIIPARAGFTRSCPSASRPATDHPRSRGVYLSGDKVTHVADGSSPLARGLRRPDRPGRRYERIIPARAGFTVSDVPRENS